MDNNDFATQNHQTPGPFNMRPARQYRWHTPPALKIAIGLLMILSILELAFVSSTVAWLHGTASGTFSVRDPSANVFNLRGEPARLLTDQGHTSNAAAGTGLILIGFGGMVVLGLRHHFCNKLTRVLYMIWLWLNPAALALTFAALVFVMAVTRKHASQDIDASTASQLSGATATGVPASAVEKYPLLEWTPQGWFSAVLRLNLVEPNQRNDISNRLRIMNGWMWNLVPMFIVQFVQTVLAILDGKAWRREWRKTEVVEVKDGEMRSRLGAANLWPDAGGDRRGQVPGGTAYNS